MRKHAKEIVNAICWVAYGVIAYFILMAALGIVTWYVADKYIAPSLYDKVSVAVIVAINVVPEILKSLRTMKGGA